MLGNKKIMGNNIQIWMDIYELSRKDFAKAIGEPYSSVTDWINGKTYPRIDKIQKMADFFGIEKADLVESRELRIAKKTVKEDLEANLIEAYWNADEITQKHVRMLLNVPDYDPELPPCMKAIVEESKRKHE